MRTKESLLKSNAYAWLVLLLSACFLFYKYILQIAPSVMSSSLMQTYSLSGAGLGFLVGSYFYTYMLMQIPSGILLDKYGARKLTSLAILFCICGTIIFSVTHSVAIAYCGRLLIGFGAAFATTSYMKLASNWFALRYFPLLSGLFGTACMTGAGTAEAPLAWLVHLSGWRTTLIYCALSGIVLFILFLIFVKNEKSGSSISAKASPATEQFKFRSLINLFKNKSNWPLLLYSGLAFTPVAVFGGLWGVPYIMEAYGLPKVDAAASVSLAFFGFAIGGIVVGWIGKQMQRQLPIIVIGTSVALFFLCMVLYVPDLPKWVLDACIFLFGFGASSFLLSYAIAKNINSVVLVGTVIGLINLGDPLCGSIAEPLIGKILDLTWHGLKVNNVRIFSIHAYQLGLSVLSIYLLLALVCCFFIKETQGIEAQKLNLQPISKDPITT